MERHGDIPEKFQQKIQKEYSRLNEAFNYNFNIYKELKENDLERNYSLKNQVIHELKALSSLKDIGKLRIELKVLQNKWEEIGPTFKEHWENIKKNIGKKYIPFSIELMITMYNWNPISKKTSEKKTLIEKAKELGSILPEDAKSWESKTQKFKNLQEEWKKAGPVAKNISDEVWNEFRSHFDAFFEKRNSFLNTEKKKWKANADAKQAIVDKAKGFVENVQRMAIHNSLSNCRENGKKLATQAVLQNKNFGKSLDNNVTPSLIKKMRLKMNFLKKRKRI